MGACHCAVDGGDACEQRALTEAETPERRAFVEWLAKSRRASRVPYHVIDPDALRKIATVIRAG